MRALPWFPALLVIAPLVQGTAQLDQPKWTTTLDQDVVFWWPLPNHTLLVGTQGTILAIDQQTGKELWRRGGFPDYVPEEGTSSVDAFGSGHPPPTTVLTDVTVLRDVDDVVLTFDSGGVHSRLEVLNLRNGARRWVSDGLPFDDLRGYVRASPSVLLLYGTSVKPGVAPEQVLVGVDLDAGHMRWRRRDVFTAPPVEFEVAGSGLEASRGTISGNQWPVLEGDTAAILFWSADGPINIDLRTGERIWATRLNVVRPPAISQDYPPLLVADGVLYAPFDHSLQALSVSDGHPLWSEPKRFIARVAQLELMPEGLLVRGANDWAPLLPSIVLGSFPAGRFIDLVDPATGASRWPRRDKPLPIGTRFVRQGDWVYGATHDSLYRIALATGSARSIASLKFEDNGFPQGLELRNGDLLISNTQTLMLFDTVGAAVYHAYFPPASAFQLTRVSRDYVYMMTKHADSSGQGASGMLKISKDTGKPERRAIFGDSWGSYRLDESLALLFRLQRGRVIECYDF